MQINEKIEIYEIITKKFLSSKNYQIQEICFWIINILIRHHVVRNRVKNYLILIETKRCEWICLPDITALEKRVIDFRQRITNNLKYVRDNLPQKLCILFVIQKMMHLDISAIFLMIIYQKKSKQAQDINKFLNKGISMEEFSNQ